VIDCHTGAFHSWKWEWTTPMLRWICRRAAAALVHTEFDETLVRSWGAPVLLVPDDVPDPGQATPSRQATRPCVVVAGSLDQNEPVAMTLAAAALLPEVDVRLTGDPQRVLATVQRAAPPNAVFTGWLDYSRFLGELVTANVVAVFSTDPYIMNRAAFEAVGLRRPLVLSDLEGLRARFGQGALFSPNEPEAMAATLRQALQQQEELARRSAQLRGHLVAQHQQAIARLKTVLEVAPPPAPSPAAHNIGTLGT
jgi:glycosyltransferase involved in cell wall biosynthesis